MKASRLKPFSLAVSLLSGFPEEGPGPGPGPDESSLAPGMFREESGIL